jgi:predicted nucleic acid-binding protein
MERPKRLLFDTSVYIAAIRGGLFCPAFRVLNESLPRTHLASVVAAELLAGATTPGARRAVLTFIRRAHAVRRVVTPDATSWERAGELLGSIRQGAPHLRSKTPTLWNDLLIALSARQIGATVLTQNARDFTLIHQHLPFSLCLLSDPA